MPETVEAVLSPLLEEVIGPISDANPVGDDVSYDDDFLSLKDEVDQLSSVNPEGVDDGRILERCKLILGRKSKDLRVATYMALALARIGGYRGIDEGLTALKLLVEKYWEPMYPPIKRMRARQNALQFVAERLSDALPALTPTAGDREAIENSLQAVKELQTRVMELMGDQAPILSGLGRALEDTIRKIPAEVAKKAPTPATTVQDEGAKSAEPQAPDGEMPPTSTSPPPQPIPAASTDTDALEQVLTLAGFVREQKPSDSVSYRLARCALWDAISVEPNNEDGRTFFEDPPSHRMTYLNSLFDGQEWQTLLTVAEDAFHEPPYHFWLDLQRFVAAAMGGLGGEYEQAKRSVLLETAVLVQRVPSLPHLTFLDGTPFADPKTAFWLEETVAPVLTAGTSNGSSREDAKLEGRFDDAKKLASGGRLADAIQLLQDAIQQDGTRRGRFLLRLTMARLCMQASKPGIAGPILENLESEIEALTLHEWEPVLALEVWSQLHQCYGMLSADEARPQNQQDRVHEKAQRVFDRICHVDPARALER